MLLHELAEKLEQGRLEESNYQQRLLDGIMEDMQTVSTYRDPKSGELPVINAYYLKYFVSKTESLVSDFELKPETRKLALKMIYYLILQKESRYISLSMGGFEEKDTGVQLDAFSITSVNPNPVIASYEPGYFKFILMRIHDEYSHIALDARHTLPSHQPELYEKFRNFDDTDKLATMGILTHAVRTEVSRSKPLDK